MKPKTFSILASVFVLAALLMTSGNGILAQGPLPPQGPHPQAPEAEDAGSVEPVILRDLGPQSPEAAAANVNADGIFTYQGQLKFNSTPYDGACDFSFRLYDAATSGLLVAGPYTATNVIVSKGLFSVPINYQNWGPQRGIQIAVRCPAGSGSYQALNPRQKITAAPYANSLRPGSYTAYTDASGNTLTGVYISDPPWAGIDAYAYYTGTPGLYGYTGANANTPGVMGISGPTGVWRGNTGVMGLASQGTRANAHPGGAFYDAGGTFVGPNGVIGAASKDSSDGYGVIGITTGTFGVGVYAESLASTGANYGVYGTSRSSNGTGVYGQASSSTGTTYGVYGTSSSASGIGVRGVSVSGVPGGLGGMYSPAVWGDTNTGNGVIGTSSRNGGAAVVGSSTGGGLVAGVRGTITSTSGYAGWFDTSAGNGVYITTPSGKVGLNVVGGSKNAVVRTSEGSRLLYTEESTQVWFTDYGFGKLVNGVAVIPIDPIFAQTVNLKEPYHVFVQVYGDAEVYVGNRTPTQFEVHLRGSGDSNVEFSYRIVAMRLGYENARLAPAPWADNDPNLYPERQNTYTGPGSLLPGSVETNVSPQPAHQSR